MTPRGDSFRVLPTVLALAAVLALAVTAPGQERTPRFPHDRHGTVLPVCTTCHAGVLDSTATIWPDPARCASCHDGSVEARVAWRPPTTARPSNLRFTHVAHRRAVALQSPADSGLVRNCAACHVAEGAPRMAVRRAEVANCISCHGLPAPHVDNSPTECARCHVRLTDASSLTTSAIAQFPRPSSHDADDFAIGGHGALVRPPGGGGRHGPPPGDPTVPASCATCHSRDLCLACHVNAPEVAPIGALELDPRVPPYTKGPPTPSGHGEPDFLRAHGRQVRRGDASCASCHTRESCTTCHQASPPATPFAMADAGPGRALGAHVTRRPPTSHTPEFREGHAALANARPTSCESCHLRATCLTCHRPDVAQARGYHPTAYLTRHPSDAYARSANCTDCHNPAQFCQSCHQQAGLVASGRLGRLGYHDAFRGFSLGHGQAARQSLETCAGCHAERDCTACHSSVGGGYGFSPHGPGFNPERALRKNPSVCIACHGRAIPRRR